MIIRKGMIELVPPSVPVITKKKKARPQTAGRYGSRNVKTIQSATVGDTPLNIDTNNSHQGYQHPKTKIFTPSSVAENEIKRALDGAMEHPN